VCPAVELVDPERRHVSLSIPFNAVANRAVSRMDRTHIPFRALFERSMTGEERERDVGAADDGQGREPS
jgi:hypothetical protein